MSVSVQVGSFLKRAGTGAQSITGVGFTPKAVLFTTAANMGSTFTDTDAVWSRGFDDGTHARAIAARYRDNVTLSTPQFKTTASTYNKGISVAVPNHDTLGAANLVSGAISSLDADGFTFTWGVSTPAYTNMVVSYVALGGSTVSAVVGSAASSATTGAQTFTGLGLTPSAVLLFAGLVASDLDAREYTYWNNLGWFDTVGCQGATGLWAYPTLTAEDPTAHGFRTQRTDRCLALINATGTTAGSAIYSAVAAGQFTIDWQTATGGNYPICYLALSGVGLAATSFSPPMPSTSSLYRLTGTGLTPKGVLWETFSETATTAIVAEAQYSGGASDFTTSHSDWAGIVNGVVPTETATYHSPTNAVIGATPATTGSASTLDARVFNVSAVTDGVQFSWNNNGIVKQVLAAVIGERVTTPAVCVTAAIPVTGTPTTFATRRVRRFPHSSDQQQWVRWDALQVDVQAGVGLTEGQGADPSIQLRWSDDGGHTWRGPITTTVGRLGQYRARAKWRRLGHSRDRIFEVSMSDPVQWVLLQALAQIQPGRF